jgi:HicB family
MAAQTRDVDGRARKRTRLMVDVTPELRRRLKVAAAQQDLSLREYVERVLESAVPIEAAAAPRRRPLTPETVADLRRVRDQISGGRQFTDPAPVVERMREERSEDLLGR